MPCSCAAGAGRAHAHASLAGAESGLLLSAACCCHFPPGREEREEAMNLHAFWCKTTRGHHSLPCARTVKHSQRQAEAGARVGKERSRAHEREGGRRNDRRGRLALPVVRVAVARSEKRGGGGGGSSEDGCGCDSGDTTTTTTTTPTTTISSRNGHQNRREVLIHTQHSGPRAKGFPRIRCSGTQRNSAACPPVRLLLCSPHRPRTAAPSPPLPGPP